MSSPSRDQTVTTASSNSPSRYHNRYAERFKSLTQSPSRESPEKSITTYLNTTKTNLEPSYISPLKNSPLQPNRVNEHKIFEGEKYISYEIKNEDRGEWREKMLNQQVVDEVVVEEEQVNTSPIPKSRTPPNTQQTREQHHNTNEQQHHKNEPHYMRATEAFEQRLHTAKKPVGRREHNTDNLLRPRSKGGITKRVGTSKIPNYRSTTSINAIDDIKNEMTPGDVYIPMAARIKMFEKGLGNASNKPAPITPQYSTSSSTSSSSYNKQHRQSPTPSSSTRASPATYDASLPRYARPTSATQSRKIITPTTSRSTTVKKTKATEPKEVKPFHFATSERAQHYEQSFNEKLNLWKGKDKLASIESYNNNKALKRKRETPTTNTPPNKTARL